MVFRPSTTTATPRNSCENSSSTLKLSKDTPTARSNPFDVDIYTEEPELLLCRNDQESCGTAIEPAVDDITTMKTLEVGHEKQNPQDKVADSVNRPETVGASCFMDVDLVIFRNIVNAEVERQVADSLNDLI